MSQHEIKQLYKKAQSAVSRAKHVKEQADEIVDVVVGALESTGIAFAMGMVNGRYNGVEVVGVPLDLIVGAGAHGLGFLGVGGTHLHAMGTGSLCSYTNTLGAGIGREMALKAAKQAQQLPAGAQGMPPLSAQQLRDLASGHPAG